MVLNLRQLACQIMVQLNLLKHKMQGMSRLPHSQSQDHFHRMLCCSDFWFVLTFGIHWFVLTSGILSPFCSLVSNCTSTSQVLNLIHIMRQKFSDILTVYIGYYSFGKFFFMSDVDE
ncbi:uncharacterized protein LOC110708191 isoform X3 [Chenopodium quinoa]|uniref:uncharacterized protein LOC110708191 isoform X3 n=1 Tax=Chenopodium quinoa TaxID=63459 RepID=UPI000B7869A1|nr:uncharacterized protein LOC110708191 isoform X3 [Chenopodium quinoa]